MKHSALSALAIAFLMIAGAMAVAVNVTAWGEIDEEGIFETVEDYDDDGKINHLVINVPVQNISWYGSVFLRDFIAIDTQLWNEAGTVYIGSYDAERDIEPDSEDNLTVQVKVSGREINASEVDGPYLVKMWITHYVTEYYGLGLPIVSDSLGYFEYVTEGYAHDEFETPDPYTISRGWEVVDDDENGLYDWLRVNLTVNATDGDIVEISLELSAEVGPDLITYSDQRTLDAGYNQTVYIDIDGRLMNGLAREDTWYWIYISVTTLDGFKDSGWVSTDSLNASDFEEYVVSVVDGPVWTLIDGNDDGLHDFLRVSFNTTVQETLKYRLRMRLSDENSYWSSTQYFDGYLIEGFEETVVAYFDASGMFDYASTGPFNLEISEQPATYNKWPGYDYIEAIYLDNMTIEELDTERLNHPDTIFISGYVTDEEGDPIVGAVLYASAQDYSWGWYAFSFSTTDIDGMYNLIELIPGSISMGVQAVGYFSETLYTSEVVSNTTDFNFTLESSSPADATIWGTVFDIEGNPVADAVVGLIRPGSGVAGQTSSDEAGNYSLDIRAGDYAIEAAYLDFGNPDTISVELTVQWVSLPQGSSINNDITLNLTYDSDIDSLYDMSISRSIWFESWDTLSMRSTLTQHQENDIMSSLYALSADIAYGNADGYVDEEENAIIQSLFGESYLLFMDEYQSSPRRCERYTLDSFSVDGIGYLAQPDDVQLTLFDLTGSIWETRDLTVQLDVGDMNPYWPILEDETHELYLEVEYASGMLLPYIHSEGYDITAPDGFVLNSTNEPENIDIDGMNHVTITPGDSPDPDNVSSALVVLEFRRETGPGVGSVHGVALLQGETDHAGIEITLLDQSLTILDQMTTGSTGEFAFPELEPGSYWVRANFSGYIDVYAEVPVTSEEITEVNLELLPVDSIVDLGGISGRIVTQAGLPLEGATINLYSPVDGATPVMTETVGADGEFEFSDLESGEFKLEISADGFEDKIIFVMLNTGEVMEFGDIELLSDMPVGYITGILESSDNESIVGATVEVRASGSDTILADGETNSDGVFLIIGLDDGVYNLTFVLAGEIIGYAEVEVEDFVGDAGRIVIDISDAEDQGDPEQLWPWILLLAIVAVAAVAVALMKLKKPKGSQPMKLEEAEETTAEQE